MAKRVKAYTTTFIPPSFPQPSTKIQIGNTTGDLYLDSKKTLLVFYTPSSRTDEIDEQHTQLIGTFLNKYVAPPDIIPKHVTTITGSPSRRSSSVSLFLNSVIPPPPDFDPNDRYNTDHYFSRFYTRKLEEDDTELVIESYYRKTQSYSPDLRFVSQTIIEPDSFPINTDIELFEDTTKYTFIGDHFYRILKILKKLDPIIINIFSTRTPTSSGKHDAYFVFFEIIRRNTTIDNLNPVQFGHPKNITKPLIQGHQIYDFALIVSRSFPPDDPGVNFDLNFVT